MTDLAEARTRIGAAGGAATRAGRPVRRLHAIARRGERGPELLCLTLHTGKEALPLFSSGGAARSFLAFRELDGTWYAREYCAGELASLLLGLYAGIDGVLLDPAHGYPAGEYVPESYVPTESFVCHLLDDARGVWMQQTTRMVERARTP